MTGKSWLNNPLLRFDAFILALGLGLFVVNAYLVKPILNDGDGVVYLFFANYANDVLGGLAFLAYTNLLFDLVKKKYRIVRVKVGLGYIFLCGLVWECVTPLFVGRSVSDWIDILAYLAGASLYYAASSAYQKFAAGK